MVEIRVCGSAGQSEYDFLKDIENIKNHLRYMFGVDIKEVRRENKLLRTIVISGDLDKVKQVLMMYSRAHTDQQYNND